MLLLQKLLLLPGNLRTDHTNTLECIYRMCVCACVCGGGVHVFVGPGGDVTHLQVSEAPVARQRVDALV